MNNLKDLTRCFENLTEESLEQLGLFYDENAFFKDPFNEIEGKDKIIKIFKHMFKNFENPYFVILDTIESSDGAFLTWNFFIGIKGREHKIHGSSHLKYNGENKIVYHRDYWDVGEEILLKFPLIKLIYSHFRKKMALPKEYLF